MGPAPSGTQLSGWIPLIRLPSGVSKSGWPQRIISSEKMKNEREITGDGWWRTDQAVCVWIAVGSGWRRLRFKNDQIDGPQGRLCVCVCYYFKDSTSFTSFWPFSIAFLFAIPYNPKWLLRRLYLSLCVCVFLPNIDKGMCDFASGFLPLARVGWYSQNWKAEQDR